ncbi:hypothetical protein [Sneathiella litorea]|uniref:Uncharacterized protein n=1 Tax=Sneathiella litorea TaxID=2606216 RepID=A0A6L8WA55_9PROT|nr:hypothetical protein [Sneathiella litorea]MZR31300.1 hypothetical protein [Sneathiella litorea]
MIFMKYDKNYSLLAAELLTPRDNLPWNNERVMRNFWMRPFLIDNQVTRAYVESVLLKENKERTILRDTVEGELVGLSAVKHRFWLAEYRFLEKLMTFRQLAIYAPAFLSLSRIMPKKLVFNRRLVVQKYLELHPLPKGFFVTKVCRQFVRSSVLLYSAEKLIGATDKFISLVIRSADQSRAANCHRVAMQLRALHLMSDQEICDQFKCEEEYLSELVLLERLARYYRLAVDDIFRISAAEIKHFWDVQC